MHDTSQPNDDVTGRAPDVRNVSAGTAVTFDQVLAGSTLLAVVALLVYKVVLVRRLNVNWDEFYFLSHVYSLVRGELALILQVAYTHLFTWLTRLPGDEMEQIVVARYVMMALLGITTWLIWRLGRRWLDGFAALVPCFVYLSAVPVILHGGSFRFDSMLAPLSIAALLLLWSPGRSSRGDWLAGLLVGLAMTISIKVVLFAPLFLAAIVTRSGVSAELGRQSLQATAVTLVRVGIVAAAVAAVLLGLHALSAAPGAADSLAGAAGGAARKTLLESPWFPRIRFLEVYVRWQPLHWLLIALGTLIAIKRRRFDVASLALALLPIAFYRNAFAYYYVVMLAPASVLAGYAVHEMRALVRLRASATITSALVGTIWIGLLYQGLAGLHRLNVDDQVIQRRLIAGVHEVFPQPVNYVDRCGMISSFRKVNFFMSTWGMETYRARNMPFMRDAIRNHQPAFVLVNSSFLDPNQRFEGGLLPDDYELIARYYPKYWGPLRVAGASARFKSTEERLLTVPFPAEYRIRTDSPIRVDGVLRSDGEVVFVSEAGIRVSALEAADGVDPVLFQLFLATAKPPPNEQLPNVPLFSGL
jgi:hypothetical protein